MSISLMEILTLINVIFLALTYLGNHRKDTTDCAEDGIDYKFNGESTIMVKNDTIDQTKATLVQEGCPKSGFTYDTLKDNAGMLTTNSNKKSVAKYGGVPPFTETRNYIARIKGYMNGDLTTGKTAEGGS